MALAMALTTSECRFETGRDADLNARVPANPLRVGFRGVPYLAARPGTGKVSVARPSSGLATGAIRLLRSITQVARFAARWIEGGPMAKTATARSVPVPDRGRLLTFAQACEYLNVTDRWLRRACVKGLIVRHYLPGGRLLRFYEADLREAMEVG